MPKKYGTYICETELNIASFFPESLHNGLFSSPPVLLGSAHLLKAAGLLYSLLLYKRSWYCLLNRWSIFTFATKFIFATRQDAHFCTYEIIE